MADHSQHDEEAEENIKRIVDEYGWFVAKFPATDYLPSFCYTIGLWKTFKHPELISFGLTTETLGSILNIAGDLVKAGETIDANTESDLFFENSNAYLLEVDPRNINDYFGYGLWYNQGNFPAIQIVWPDREGNYPWNEDFSEEFEFRQPLTDRNYDFKFREPKNLAVFTNRHYLDSDRPICYITHDREGDWQFLTNDDFTDEDARIVCLENIIKKDPTLNDIFDLNYGEFAEREGPRGQWYRGKSEII